MALRLILLVALSAMVFAQIPSVAVSATSSPADANAPVAIEEVLSASDGFVPHLRALARAHTYAILADGKPIPIDAIIDEYNFQQAKLRVALKSPGARISLSASDAAARGKALASPLPGHFDSTNLANPTLAPGTCAKSVTLCATFQQAGSESFVLPNAYPKRFASDPAAPTTLSTATLEYDRPAALRKGSDGLCIEDIVDANDGDAAFKTPVACPGSKLQFDVPGCVKTCAPQRATLSLSDAFSFQSYVESASCATSHFVVTILPGTDDTIAHTLTFEIAHPAAGIDNASVTCEITVIVSGPHGAKPAE